MKMKHAAQLVETLQSKYDRTSAVKIDSKLTEHILHKIYEVVF